MNDFVSIQFVDPFAKNLLDWRDELRALRPINITPENDYSKQPCSDKYKGEVRQSECRNTVGCVEE